MTRLLFETELPVPAAEAFAWHVRPGAFGRLSPPFSDTEIVVPPVVEEGREAKFVIKLGPVPVPWVAVHQDVEPPHRFVDVQKSGPFTSWRHEHRFAPLTAETSTLSDDITFEAPLSFASAGAVKGMLEQMFAYRHALFVDDLRAHRAWGFGRQAEVAITGASGLIGRALSALLTTGGHTVVPVARKAQDEAGADAAVLDVEGGWANPRALEGRHAVVHLAGESVFGDRWSADKKRRILESRVRGTRALVEACQACAAPPKVFVCASAIGWYGDGGDADLDEQAPRGDGFLADVVEAWEGALDGLRALGTRVVMVRTGVVLTAAGGALKKQLPLFKAGLGGKVGSGQQWQSVIGLDDVLDIYLRALFDEQLSGPVNAVGPEPVRQHEFAETLARVLGRPAITPAPGFAVRAALGKEQADALVLTGAKVRPGVLEGLGHRFRHRTLEDMLRFTLGR